MAVFTTVMWAMSLYVMWTTPCESRLVAVKMKNATSDMGKVEARVSELSLKYEKVEGVCAIWAHKRKKGPGNCVEVQKSQPDSGVATIYLQDDTPLDVYCDQETDGGGWTVFQRRQDGSVDFYRNWTQYQQGFGDLDGEFWLGLDALHMLTSSQPYELRVDLMMFNGTKGHAAYSNFSIGNSSDNYRLHVGNFTGGNAGDSLTTHNGMQFSTKDADHDNSGDNCAVEREGAWWYHDCMDSALNGPYYHTREYGGGAVEWTSFDDWYHLKFSEMKMRPM